MTYVSPPTAARLAAWFMRRTAPSGARRVAPLKAAVASDVGVVRQENQDRVALVRACDRSGGAFVLAALADGIGGMKNGAECAALALGTFLDGVISEAQHSADPRDWLWRAANMADRAVHAKHMGNGGSTLVAVLLTKGHRPLWLSIGDSRVYLAADAKIRQLSCDDTLEGQLGKVTGGRRADLLQFVGLGEALEPHIEPVPWDASGTIMLTSDGVHFVEDDYLAKVVHFAPDAGVCVKRLTEFARMLGGPDNASVAAVSMSALLGDGEPLLDASFEVWDPFGELQVMFDRGAKRFSSNAGAQAPQQTPSPTPNPTPAPAPIAASIPINTNAHSDGPRKTEKPPVGKDATVAAPPEEDRKDKQQQRKSKKAKMKPHPAGGDKSTDEAEVPQMLIEFPNKTP